MLRLLFSVFILTGILDPSPGAESVFYKLNSSFTEYMESELSRMMRKYHLPAMAITIVDGEDVIYQEARGLIDIENNIAATSESIFKLWSLAKVFTAVEIFRETEEGIIDLDSPVSNYLPAFTIRSRFTEEDPITVKSMLAHRSGLPRNECLKCEGGDKEFNTLERFEESVSACYMAYPPGFRYKYSNLAYDLLGRIIEENREMGFPDYMKEELLEKLGMYNSTFCSKDVGNPGQLALGYEYYKRKYYPLIQSDINSVPSGNLYSTIEDLSLFLKSALNNQLFNNKHTLKKMFSDHYSEKNDPETMGLGWKTTRIAGQELMVWHDGGPGEGTGSLIAMLPDQKIGIAVVANSTSFSSNRIIPFVKDILTRLSDESKEQQNSQVLKSGKYIPETEVLDDCEGKYIAFGRAMHVKAKKRKLKAKIGGMNLNFVPVSETEYKVTHWVDKVGLTKIIQPPVDFDKLSVSFLETDSRNSRQMIINLDNITYEICPRYPDQVTIDDKWNSLSGEYQLAWRESGDKPGHFSGDVFTIILDDQILSMSGVFGPILPLDETYIRILSGPFAGETMEYFPETGFLIHQNAVFVSR